MSYSQESCINIKITHFINPHMFWFQEVNDDNKKCIDKIEETINELYNSDSIPLSSFGKWKQALKVDEIVALKHLDWNKYVRAKIIYIREIANLEFSYILWILDYGFPLESERKYIRKLPMEYAKLSKDIIHFGSLIDIMPGLEFKLGPMGRTIIESKNWTNNTINVTKKLLKKATSITFVYNQELMLINQEINQKIGYLLLNNDKNDIIDLRNYLILNNLAVKCIDFINKINKSDINKIEPFRNNERDINVMKNKFSGKMKHEGYDSNTNDTNAQQGPEEENFANNEKPKTYFDEPIYKVAGKISEKKLNFLYPPIPLNESFSFDDLIILKTNKNNDGRRKPLNESTPISTYDDDSFSQLSNLTINSDDSVNSENKLSENSTNDRNQRIENILKLRTQHRKLIHQKNATVNEASNNTPNPKSLSSLKYLPAGFDLRNLAPEKNWENKIIEFSENFRGRRVPNCYK